MQKVPFKVGDIVAVQPGVTDADMGGDIGGWQGRVTHVYAEVMTRRRWTSSGTA